MTKPFSAPNYTQFSNDAIDTVMREVSPNTWKVITVAIRKTYGFHKESDQISYSQFQEITGIKSRDTLTNAINEAVEKGILLQGKDMIPFEYSLNREYENGSVPETGTGSVPETGTGSVPETGSTKETPLKEKRNSAQKTARVPATIEEAIIYGGDIPEDQLGEDARFKADVDEACFLICQNNMHLEPLAREFMLSRKIILNPKKRSGHLKALKEMYDAKPNRVQPEHVSKAIEDAKESPKIYNKIVDLFGIIKLAIGAANALPGEKEPDPIKYYQPEDYSNAVPKPRKE